MPKCPTQVQSKRTINIKWKCSTSKNALAAHPPCKVLQSSHFIVKNFSVLSFFESFRCSAWISILLFTWASSAVLVNFCSFLPSPFFFFLSTTSFYFSISSCPLFSIIWEKRSKFYGETRDWRFESRKRKNAKTNRETRKKKEVQQFF